MSNLMHDMATEMRFEGYPLEFHVSNDGDMSI